MTDAWDIPEFLRRKPDEVRVPEGGASIVAPVVLPGAAPKAALKKRWALRGGERDQVALAIAARPPLLYLLFLLYR